MGRRRIVGHDDGSEVGLERTTHVLLPAALEADLPALGIGEAEPIKGREPHKGPPRD
jgi:hypothetical protein